MQPIQINLKREYGYDRWRFVAAIRPEEKPVLKVTSPAILEHESSEMTEPALRILAKNVVYVLRINLADFSPPPCDCQNGYKMDEKGFLTPCPKEECADYAWRIRFVPLGPIEVTAEDSAHAEVFGELLSRLTTAP